MADQATIKNQTPRRIIADAGPNYEPVEIPPGESAQVDYNSIPGVKITAAPVPPAPDELAIRDDLINAGGSIIDEVDGEFVATPING